MDRKTIARTLDRMLLALKQQLLSTDSLPAVIIAIDMGDLTGKDFRLIVPNGSDPDLVMRTLRKALDALSKQQAIRETKGQPGN